MNDWKDLLKDYGNRDLEERKSWYNPVAEAYNRVRPRYPQEIITRVLELAQLPPNASILEIGSGPGIATVSFAKLGFSLIALEPSREAADKARQNCAQFPQVRIENRAFEEWEITGDRLYDAILAATSWHWLSPEIAYPKAKALLKENGLLILLWNTPPQLSYEVYQTVEETYQNLAPSIPPYARYDAGETHQKNFRQFEQDILASGYFENLAYECLTVRVKYSLDDYLTLLSTLSPYIALQTPQRTALFIELKEILARTCGQFLELSYLSAFHLAKKIL